jgi:hypothetical protein
MRIKVRPFLQTCCSCSATTKVVPAPVKGSDTQSSTFVDAKRMRRSKANRSLLRANPCAVGMTQGFLSCKVTRSQLPNVVPDIGDEHPVLPLIAILGTQRSVNAKAIENAGLPSLRGEGDDLVGFAISPGIGHGRGMLLPEDEVLQRLTCLPQEAQNLLTVFIPMHEVVWRRAPPSGRRLWRRFPRAIANIARGSTRHQRRRNPCPD